MVKLQQVDDTFESYQHHQIDVDDMDDENLLEHFPSAIEFIQSGLNAGGGVLVHWSVTLPLRLLLDIPRHWKRKLILFVHLSCHFPSSIPLWSSLVWILLHHVL